MTYLDRTDAFIRELEAEAYLVGGAVRDSFIPGRRIKDGDYVVRLSLDELKRRLRKTGVEFGPLALRSGKVVGYRATRRGIGAVEIALPRVERKVEGEGVGNERHRFEIVVDPAIPLAEDAIRRDFTMNAMYRNVDTGEIVDPLGGYHDLTDELIRTTHEDSFKDDPLRILRALRFVSVLGFDIEHVTLLQMEQHASAVTGLTGKGVSGTALDELSKILMGRHVAKALGIARDTGVLATLLPELAPMIDFDQNNIHHNLTVDQHTFLALDWAARANLNLRTRFALLFHDAGKPESSWLGEDGFLHFYANPDGSTEDHAVVGAKLARKALKRLNADSKLRRDVPLLIERHMVPLTKRVKPTKVRKWRCEIGDDLLADLFKHRIADCMAKAFVSNVDVEDNSDIQAISRMEAIREEAVRLGVPASAKDLKDAGLIDGNDLIGMGIEGGDIGRILSKLLHEVVSDPEKRMDRNWLLERAAKLAGKA